MRDLYHEALDQITDELVTQTRLVTSMIQRASAALLEVDREKAEVVIAADEELDALNQEVETKTTDLIALQQPVATDLRLLVGAMRMSMSMERMGDLAQHIAKIARMRYPESAVPESLRPTFSEMAEVANRMAVRLGDVVSTKDLELARALEKDDDEMDRLHLHVLDTLLAQGEGVSSTGEAVDLTLLNRYYERFADHAVSVARRVVYLVIGERLADHDHDF